MATPPLKGVCCRSAYQTSGGQCVITSFDVPMKEELLVDNLDTVEARSVSINIEINFTVGYFCFRANSNAQQCSLFWNMELH